MPRRLPLVHTVYVYQRPANGNEGQYTHAYRQGFAARKRARARLEVVVSTRLVRVRPGVGLALVLLVEQAVVPSGIDEQGVDK